MKFCHCFLEKFFGTETKTARESLKYALLPYSKQGYSRDKELLSQHNSAANPQTKFLIIHAAKVERTPIELLK